MLKDVEKNRAAKKERPTMRRRLEQAAVNRGLSLQELNTAIQLQQNRLANDQNLTQGEEDRVAGVTRRHPRGAKTLSAAASAARDGRMDTMDDDADDDDDEDDDNVDDEVNDVANRGVLAPKVAAVVDDEELVGVCGEVFKLENAR